MSVHKPIAMPMFLLEFLSKSVSQSSPKSVPQPMPESTPVFSSLPLGLSPLQLFCCFLAWAQRPGTALGQSFVWHSRSKAFGGGGSSRTPLLWALHACCVQWRCGAYFMTSSPIAQEHVWLVSADYSPGLIGDGLKRLLACSMAQVIVCMCVQKNTDFMLMIITDVFSCLVKLSRYFCLLSVSNQLSFSFAFSWFCFCFLVQV